MDRTPLNIKYCRKVRCSYRNRTKCTLLVCIRPGNEKRASYFTKTNRLAEG
ncbi:hypothetical protein LCGC14_2140090, partial [marine sediment metagenome]